MEQKTLGDEIPALLHMLTCNIDDVLRIEMEGRLTHALKRKAQVNGIVREAQERIAATRVVCELCTYSARCSACPIEAHAQRVALSAQKLIHGLR